MDNAPIHTTNEISSMVTERGYNCVYLSPYSHKLNTIRNFFVVKNKVKCSSLENSDDLTTKISEAYNVVPPSHLKAFVQRSADTFEKCMGSELI
jgi:transposase